VILSGMDCGLARAEPPPGRAYPSGLPRLSNADAPASSDPWWGRDKKLHFLATSTVAVSGYGLAALDDQPRPVRLALGAGLALGVGLAKEGVDLIGPGDASHRDLAWDVVGAASGLLLAWAVDRIVEIWHRD
jgi:putative lipoprotein